LEILRRIFGLQRENDKGGLEEETERETELAWDSMYVV